MDLRRLTDDISVAPQIAPGDIPALAEAGFKTIICNRPDGESGPAQPSFAEIAAAAEAAGMTAHHLPIESGGVDPADGDAMRALLDGQPGPVLAYCRSGTRSTVLWALAKAGTLPVADILGTAAEAGYDIGGLAPVLQARST